MEQPIISMHDFAIFAISAYLTQGMIVVLDHPQELAVIFSKCLSVLDILENNRAYCNQNPRCEPQMGKRGLYGAIGGQQEARLNELAMLWVLNLSDGTHSLLDIANRSGLAFDVIRRAAQVLREHGLLKECRK